MVSILYDIIRYIFFIQIDTHSKKNDNVTRVNIRNFKILYNVCDIFQYDNVIINFFLKCYIL